MVKMFEKRLKRFWIYFLYRFSAREGHRDRWQINFRLVGSFGCPYVKQIWYRKRMILFSLFCLFYRLQVTKNIRLGRMFLKIWSVGSFESLQLRIKCFVSKTSKNDAVKIIYRDEYKGNFDGVLFYHPCWYIHSEMET